MCTGPEFWVMPPNEVWWLIEDNLPPEVKDSMSDNSDNERLYRELKRRQMQERLNQ